MQEKNSIEKTARDILSVYGLYFAGRVLWLVGSLFLLLEGVCFLTLCNPLIILVCIFFNIFSALVGVFCGYTIIGLKRYDKGYIAAGISFILLCIAGCVSAIRIVNVPLLIAFGILAYIFGFVFCRTTGKALRSIDIKLSKLWKMPFGIYIVVLGILLFNAIYRYIHHPPDHRHVFEYSVISCIVLMFAVVIFELILLKLTKRKLNNI